MKESLLSEGMNKGRRILIKKIKDRRIKKDMSIREVTNTMSLDKIELRKKYISSTLTNLIKDSQPTQKSWD